MAKNLSDVIHGDRAAIRGGPVVQPQGSWGDSIDWGTSQNVVNFSGSSHGSYPSKKSSYSGGSYERCYKTHPPLKLPGIDLVIYGGSCSEPVVLDADVYIGFDSSMRFTQRHWPWKKGHEVLFKITDMSVPDSPEEFKKLVGWTKARLEEGLKVHCGCIGGHGRTGTFLAALVSEYGEKDAISHVRKHYCQKAVESDKQVKFLHEHFGVVKVKGHKMGGSYSTGGGGSSKVKSSSQPTSFAPMRGNGNIWGDE
jgi:hypothetical protein